MKMGLAILSALVALLCFSPGGVAAPRNLSIIGTAGYDSNGDGAIESYNL
ncbi:MAG: hypothetical protein ABIL58_21215 [Pseudomonadota bacterium]